MKKLLLFSTILFFCGFLKAQSNFINQDSVTARSTNCIGSVEVIIDSVTFDNIGNYKFILDGQPLTASFEPAVVDTFQTYSYAALFDNGETGPFRLNSWTINGTTYSIPLFNDLNQLLDSMRRWDPQSNWQLSSPLIYGFPKNGQTYSCQSIRGLTVGAQDLYCPNFAWIPKGLKFSLPPGFHQLIVNDTVNLQKDTVQITAICTKPDTIRQSLFIGVNRAHCVDVTQLLGTPQIASFTNFCAKATTNVTFDSLYNFCISYTGRAVGTDTACVRVCDQYGVCDTTYLYITAQVNPSRQYYFSDTISTSLSRQKCDITIPTGTIASFRNMCSTRSGTNITFTLDTVARCVTYKGVSIGIDTACIEVCNSLGTCDTTIMYIEAKQFVPRGQSYVFNDSILIDSIKTKGDFVKPSGTISTIKNICTSNSGSNVQFSIDAGFQTVSYRGLTVGVDTACVEVCNTDGTCDTTVFYISAKANVITPTGGQHSFSDTITVGLSRTKCDLTAPTSANKIEKIGTASSNLNVEFSIDTTLRCVIYKGLKAGSDTITVRICNASNTCDTTQIVIQALAVVLPPKPKPSVDTLKLKVFERKTYCPDQSELTGAPVSQIKFCTPATSDNSTANLNTTTHCASITGTKVGVDTFCLEICNSSGICDTTTLYVQVSADTIKPTPSIDSISIKIGELKVYCPDTLELLNGTITDIRTCTNTNYDNSSMALNNVTKCAEFRGLTVGKDTACVIVCNSQGLCDTTTIYVTITQDTVKPTPSTEIVNLRIGETLNFTKIDTTQLFGAVDTIYDACPGKNGSHALMVLDRSSKTVSITGLTIGSDTMCIVVHNRTSNLYDTTTIIANVQDTAFSIKAYNDFDTLRQGRTITLKVYANDTLRGKIPTSLVIVKPALKGTADTISFRQGIISYKSLNTPNACGLDSFTYKVCVDTVCSEATVVVEVLCADSLKAYNAISPNGDGRNDAFRIEGLQKYPNNTLLIFNRWGNEVHNVKNYQNDWQGTWNNKDLPDGTYFYLLRDEDTGEVILTGYLQILR